MLSHTGLIFKLSLYAKNRQLVKRTNSVTQWWYRHKHLFWLRGESSLLRSVLPWLPVRFTIGPHIRENSPSVELTTQLLLLRLLRTAHSQNEHVQCSVMTSPLFKWSFVFYIMTNVARGVEVEKLLDVVNASDSAQPFHHSVYANGHVYLFGLKGAEQSQYSSYKRTILLGSYAVDVDLDNKTYSQSYFSSIDKTEDRKEYVFAIHDEVYMITYSEHEMCTFHDLYNWTSDSWKPVPLTVESKARLHPAGSTSNCKLSYMVVANDSVLFAFSQNDKNVIFSRLTIVGEGAVISHLFTVDKLSRPRSSIVFAGLYDQKLTAITGSQGCGFRWNSDEVLSVDLKQGSVSYYPTNGERPPWAFNGPDSTFQWNNKFLLVGGSKALGISNMSFSPEIWALDLVSYNYTKLPIEVPADVANFQLCSSFDSCSGQLFLTDLTHGLYRINMTELV